MNRNVKSFKSDDISLFKKKLFKWSEKFSTSVYLDSNNYLNRLGDIDTILASDPHTKLPFTENNSLNILDDYVKKTKDWLFGYFSYDLKNEIEDLKSDNNSAFYLPNLFFFQPKVIWIIKSNYIEAQYLSEFEIDKDWKQINSIDISENI